MCKEKNLCGEIAAQLTLKTTGNPKEAAARICLNRSIPCWPQKRSVHAGYLLAERLRQTSNTQAPDPRPHHNTSSLPTMPQFLDLMRIAAPLKAHIQSCMWT